MSSGVMPLALFVAACAAVEHPMLAEVLYDATGADTGLEFVEIFNPAPRVVSLVGLRIEAADGSAPGRWTARWTGSASDSVAAFGRFVVGGTRVIPAPAAIVELQLQNGPDAVRLVWPDGAVETLGYGPLEFSEYFCGAPAADAPSGQSLARVPDDAASGSNAIDFRAAIPSPGRANVARVDAAWVPGSLALEPEQPDLGERATLGGRVVNRGRVPIDARAIVWSGRFADADSSSPRFQVRLESAIAPGETVSVATTLEGSSEGKRTLLSRLELAGDESGENDVDSLRIRVGPGPLAIGEIQFHPIHGEGEWVEVRNRSSATVDLASFTISDRGAARGRPHPGGTPCLPESLAVLAQDRAALLARHLDLDSTRIWQVSPWPSLNNSDDASGIADAVVLRDEDGTRSARHDYRAAGIPAGVPLELEAGGLWGPAPDVEGSPLRPARVLAPLGSRFTVAPRRIGANGAPLVLGWSLPWPRARAAADLYDLAGARVATVLSESEVSARGERAWRPTGLSPGLYLVAFRAAAASGGERLTATQIVRVVGVAP